jgi:transposase InsO family protein
MRDSLSINEPKPVKIGTLVQNQELKADLIVNINKSYADDDTDIPDILVSCATAKAAMQHKAAYTSKSEPTIVDLLRKAQAKCLKCARVLHKIVEMTQEQRDSSPWSKSKDGLIRFKNCVFVLNIPAIHQEILHRNHDDPQGGHFRENRTLNAIQSRYWWHGIAADIKEYIQQCAVCQQIAVHRHKPRGLLQPLPVLEKLMEWVSMDFITDLPPSKWENRVYDSILVIVDMYTKFAVYYPCRKDMTAEDLAELIYTKFISHFGMPQNLVSDRGSLFTSAFWSSLCYLLATKRCMSTAFHPQTDGQTERQNQTLEYYLRAYINHHQDDWMRWLPYAQFVYNNSEHSVLGITPTQALMGFTPELWIDIPRNTNDLNPNAVEHVQDL